MKKILLIATSIAIFLPSFAIKTNFKPAKLRADEVMFPVNKKGDMLSLADLSVIKVKDYEQLSGQHLNFAQSLAFKAAQNKLRNSIDKDGTINNKRFQKLFKRIGDGNTGFHLGGFALGFLLGLIGVLIAYLIKDDKRHARVKWAWIGLIAWVAISLIFLLR